MDDTKLYAGHGGTLIATDATPPPLPDQYLKTWNDRERGPDVRVGDTGSDVSPADRAWKDTNPDPLTGAPGSHPGGTGLGAAAGGAAGGLTGAVIAGAATGGMLTGPAAPVGAAIGAVIGGLAGGLAGKAVAESVHPSAGYQPGAGYDEYWRETHASRPYAAAQPGHDYDRDFQPVYQFGWEASARNPDTTFDQVEIDLGNRWETSKGQSRLAWEHARPAARDAWEKARFVEADERAVDTTTEAVIARREQVGAGTPAHPDAGR